MTALFPLEVFTTYLSCRKELTTSAPAPIDILYELRTLRPDLFSKIEIMIDGGVRSGADVVKALALGAKAVGLGRPFLYANGTHGEEGVVRVCQSKSR
jgi:L-lactate dehydrogenase (cytochrome)